MKKQCLLLLFSIYTLGLLAQLTNNGGTIVIETGGDLEAAGDIINQGSISNSGTIGVNGDFDNTGGTLTSTSLNSQVVFKGTAKTIFTFGSPVTIYRISMEKNSADVILDGEVEISGQFDFTKGVDTRMNLVDFDLTIGYEAEVIAPSSDNYFIASGAGYLIKEYRLSTDKAFLFPIGDASNYTPLHSNFTGVVNNFSSIKVKVTDDQLSPLPVTVTDYLLRHWEVEASNISSYRNLLSGTYVPGDVKGSEAMIRGASYEGAEWSYLDADGSTNTVIGSVTENVTEFSGTNFFGKVDLKVLLQGAYSGGTMSTNLSLPLSSPYADAPRTVASIPTGVTDWVKLEVRDATDVSTTVSKYSAFLKSDGSIVDEDGTSLPQIKDTDLTGYIAVFHRNHLPIRTPAVLDLGEPSNYDFSTGLSQAYENTGLSTDAMVDLGAGAFGLYRANVNNDLNINIVDFILTKNNTASSQAGVYSSYDVNMDGNVNIVDFIVAKSSTATTKPAHL